MTRKYTLVVEGDSAGYSAYVPELPTILITGASSAEIDTRAAEAIRLYFEHATQSTPPAATVREIEVDLPI
jgi:predicted RNase H-like HicB family nuclease